MKTDIKAMTDKQILTEILKDGEETEGLRKVVNNILGVISLKKERTTYQDLTSIEGVDQKKAIKIMACFEISRRYAPNQIRPEAITKPEDALPLLSNIRGQLQEHFVCITMNGAGEVLGNRVITIGLLNHSLVHPREVFADAITDRAAHIIVAHNHPSGSLTPSPQDIAITTQLKEAGRLLGIEVVDHLIVTKTGHISLRERGHV